MATRDYDQVLDAKQTRPSPVIERVWLRETTIFEGRHIDHRRSTHPSPKATHRSSKIDTSISEGRHIMTSIFEGRHIDLRRVTHRSLKVDTSIFDLRKLTHRSLKIEGGNITPTIRRRILSTTALLSPWSKRSYTHSYVHV